MEIVIKKINGQDAGRSITLPESVFGIEPNDHAIYLDVKQILANQRQGTHKSKERAEIARTTKKLKKQKGTGGARAGSMKSPLFRGGGRVFGPKPRDYGFKLNKKTKSLARKSALVYKLKDNGLTVLEDFTFDTPKTKNFLKLLSDLSLSNKKTLFVMADNNENVHLSGRNIGNTKVVTVDSINTYDLLNADTLLLAESSVQKIENLLS